MSPVCRVCLATDVSMHRIINIQAKEIFEKLTSKMLREGRRPETLCYLCCSQLQKCYRILSLYQKTENVFAQLSSSGIEITQSAISFIKRSNPAHLIITPVQYVEVLPNVGFHGTTAISQQVPVKEETEEAPIKVKIEPIEANVGFEGVVYDDVSTKDRTWHIETAQIQQSKSTQHKVEYHENDTQNAKENKKHKYKKENDKKKKHAKSKKYKIEDTRNEKGNKDMQANPVVKAYTCDKAFEHKRQHTRRHNEEIYKCSKCSETFTFRNNLCRHYEIYHKKKRKYFLCDECGKKFKRCDHLKNHMKSHTGEKSHVCKLCAMPFSSRSNVQQHINSIHSNVKPFACDKCGKSFSRKGNLQEHYRVHTGEKPYNCDECDFKCSHQTNLRAHVLKMHCDSD